MSVVVELVRITKTFPGVRALDGLDLPLHAGRIHALLGENGAGKSTLINVLSGVIHPDSGDVLLDGKPVRFADARASRRHGIVAVHQEADLFPDLSVAENMGLEQGLPARFGLIDWAEQHRRTRAALEAFGEAIPTTAPAGHLTPAQRQMVEVAAAVARSARLLILDEPTSSLSAAEVEVLFGHLRRIRDQGAAIVYVSHRLEEVFALSDEVTVLRDGRRVWTGPLAETTKDRLIALMVGREAPEKMPREPRPLGPVLLRCQDLTAADGSFANISMGVRSGEVLGLYGLIGAGRTEWAQGVFGLRKLTGGRIEVSGSAVTSWGPGTMLRHGVAYVPEDRLREGICRGLSVRANAVLASLRQLAVGLLVFSSREKQQARTMSEQLAVRLRSIEQAAGTLSGGNQQKVVLGRWLARRPNVLILDEPTRGVDVGAQAEIHALIHRMAGEGRAVIWISSDLPEVVGQTDRVGVFRDGRLTGMFDPTRTSAEEIAAVALPRDETTGRRAAGFTPAGASPAARGRSPRGLVPLFREAGLLVVLVVMFALLQWHTGDFLQPARANTLAVEASLLGFVAVGTTMVILAGGLDISLGALMALSAAVGGRLWEQSWPWPVVVLLAVLVGGAGGVINAGVSLAGRVHPIVVTLGMMSVYRGLTFWWLNQQDIQVPGEYRTAFTAAPLGVELTTWLGFLVVLLTGAALRWTVFGRQLYAVGGNPSAAHRVGIERRRVWPVAFALQGMLVGLAGILSLARSGNLQATSFEDRTLTAIAAAVVGGVAITGGRGSVWGTMLGCLFLVSLGPACVALHVSPDWQRALVGGVMVTAVLLDALWRRRGS
jgi:rhamnose transport system ATP-binding protein